MSLNSINPARRSWFEGAAERAAKAAGSRYAFGLAVTTILVWAAFGPPTNYSEFWQLTINTGTTIITFLMVFLIQNSTNREAKALAVKIDELIRATGEARNELIGLEEKTETEIVQAAETVKEAAAKPHIIPRPRRWWRR